MRYNIDISKLMCLYIILIITALLIAVDTVVAAGRGRPGGWGQASGCPGAAPPHAA